VVDIKQIKEYLSISCDINGDVNIDPHTGTVDVTGSVIFKQPLHQEGRIPVQFGKVTNSFDCSGTGLITLEGAPSNVGKHFYCENNQLKSLKGAPHTVVGDFWCYTNPLELLDHLPAHVGDTCVISYAPHLPLLRLLTLNNIRFYKPDIPALRSRNVLDQYTGQGRRGAIQAARALIKAGEQLQQEAELDHNPLERNARW
jgi:hypothetical protein